MVLNEPETSLHPDLLPALARLIIEASRHTQVWVVSHASRLIAALEQHPECHSIVLDKSLGQTAIQGQGMLDAPPWHWPDYARPGAATGATGFGWRNTSTLPSITRPRPSSAGSVH